jgi:hypothetical protein
MTDPFAELKALRDGTGFWATDIDEMAMNLEIITDAILDLHQQLKNLEVYHTTHPSPEFKAYVDLLRNTST